MNSSSMGVLLLGAAQHACCPSILQTLQALHGRSLPLSDPPSSWLCAHAPCLLVVAVATHHLLTVAVQRQHAQTGRASVQLRAPCDTAPQPWLMLAGARGPLVSTAAAPPPAASSAAAMDLLGDLLGPSASAPPQPVRAPCHVMQGSCCPASQRLADWHSGTA